MIKPLKTLLAGATLLFSLLLGNHALAQSSPDASKVAAPVASATTASVIADCDICFAVQQGLAGIASELIQRVRPLPREHARSFARLYTPERLVQEANQLQRGTEQIELRLSNLLMKVHGG